MFMYLLFFVFLNIILIIFNKKIALKLNIYDLNTKNKISLLGGFFLILNIIVYYFCIYLMSSQELQSIIYNLSTFFLIIFFFLIGYYDDKFKLSPAFRLLLIIFALTIFFLNTNYSIEFLTFSFNSHTNFFFYNKFISIAFTIFCILAFLNALNFFDGINLQVILYALIILLYLLYIKPHNLIIIITISLIFFSYLNFKNLSFLGDSGVYVLSIIIYLFVIDYHNHGIMFADQIIFLFLIPGLDMIRLFFERIFKNKNPLIGDKNHIHHLIKKKIKNFVSLCILVLSAMPILLYHSQISKIIAILIAISLYLILVFILKNNEN